MSTSAHAPLDLARHDVIEGYVLSKPRMADLATVEEILERRYVGVMLAGAAMAGPEVLDKTTEWVSNHIKKRPFAYGRASWDLGVQADPMVPTITYLSLRVRHPEITIEKASALINDENRETLRRAVLELFGFQFGSPKNVEAPATTGANPPLTSDNSAPLSASAA